jgi:23S rRNA pseudouridine1911/1915/1917 synthase
VDGRPVLEAGAPVAPEAVLRWDPNLKARPRARLALSTLYEDQVLLVVDKPAGLLSVPTPGASGEDTVLARVSEYVKRLRPRRAYVGRVHRLDRDTSGALAVALAPEARAGLVRLFRDHRIERRYLALVAGSPRDEAGIVDLPIRDAYRGGARGVARPGEPSRPALTRWRVAERLHGAALLELQLETGRQHQIRAHLAAIGLPVLGDQVYGRPAPARGARRLMLHARLLAFQHPLSGERVRVESPLPEDFRRALASLRRRG